MRQPRQLDFCATYLRKQGQRSHYNITEFERNTKITLTPLPNSRESAGHNGRGLPQQPLRSGAKEQITQYESGGEIESPGERTYGDAAAQASPEDPNEFNEEHQG